MKKLVLLLLLALLACSNKKAPRVTYVSGYCMEKCAPYVHTTTQAEALLELCTRNRW